MANGRMARKAPLKSVRRPSSHSQRRIRKNYNGPRCTAALTVLASVNRSFYTCHRRLLRIFSKLSRLSHQRSSQGFRVLKKQEIVNESANQRCPSMPNLNHRKTIFLDLDETLVHSSTSPPAVQHDFVVRPIIEGEVMTFFVLKRPGVDEFLTKIGRKYEVVVFTAGLKEYASLVLEKLDSGGVVSKALYRDACREVEGSLVKDLATTGRNLKQVVIVDDNPNSYVLQPENAMPIKPFVDDMEDRELERLSEFLDSCVEADDLRVEVKNLLGKQDKQ